MHKKFPSIQCNKQHIFMQYYTWLLFISLFNNLLWKTGGYFVMTVFLKYSLVTMRTAAAEDVTF